MADDFMPLPCLVGANGQVGNRLRRAFATMDQSALYVARHPPADAIWQMDEAPPDLPGIRGRAVFVLAGALPQSGRDMTANVDLARAGVDAAREWGAAHVFVVSSSAVYGPTGPDPVDEGHAPSPPNAYARSKLDMEHATAAPDVTALRLCNVAGASEPFMAMGRRSALTLDRFPDGTGPMRSYIGPSVLARVVVALAARAERGEALPPVLNIAGRGEVAMAEIMAAGGRTFEWRPAPESAAAHVHLDVARLAAMIDLPAQDAHALLRDAAATEGEP